MPDSCTRDEDIWVSKPLPEGADGDTFHKLWFKFNEKRVVVAFSYQANVDIYHPVLGNNFYFYGTNSSDCISNTKDLYEMKEGGRFYVKIENKEAHLCYGFTIPVKGNVKVAAIRAPIKVCIFSFKFSVVGI